MYICIHICWIWYQWATDIRPMTYRQWIHCHLTVCLDKGKTDGAYWSFICVFLIFGHMYSSEALFQTTDLDFSEKVNWCLNECNRCEHTVIHWRHLVLPAPARTIWEPVTRWHTIQPERCIKNRGPNKEKEIIWEWKVMLKFFLHVK